LVDNEASGPIFKDFILEKNGITPEVECMRVEFIVTQVKELKKLPLPNQLILEYIDKEAAATTDMHASVL
jgi:hypothetical protein